MSNSELSAENLSDWIKERDNGSLEKIKQAGGPEGIAKKLKCDKKTGLTSQEVESKKKEYGENKLPEPESKNYFQFLLDALKDKTLIILIVASIVSIVLGITLPPPGESRSSSWIEGAAILVAVAIIALVTSINDYSKDKKFKQLTAEAENRKVKVYRDGKQQEISVYDLVVGDLVSLETGDYIAADLLVISGQSIQSDESPMTGEPESVTKSEEDPFLLGGCTITSGTGKAVTVAVGVHSQWGKIKGSLEKPETKTPLQTKLEELAERIGKFGLVAAIITLIALLLKWSIPKFAMHHEKWEWSQLGEVVQFVITAITIIVVAVPEGLPLAVTLSLAYSMIKMMKDNNLVRHLAACETMGGATNICSDKTGTLTQNKMTVIKFWLAGKMYDKVPEGKSDINEKVIDIFTESMCTNSSAYLTEEDGKPKVVGTKTEGALLVLSKKLGKDYEEIRNANEVTKVYPFSSKKKRMSSIVKSKEGTNLHVKGASEVVLDLCNSALGENGEPKKFEEKTKQELLKQIEEWAAKGYRTLTIAYATGKDITPQEETEQNLGPMDKDLILIGMVAIEDPVREEVVEAVKNCQKAGIKIRMVTGDNLLTAKEIARQCGILTEGGDAIEGPKFRQLSEDQLDQLIPKLQVVARCSPEDKLILVKRLRDQGEVVACTGDGSNDAPILREADVGFAMGITGTEVAKDACDIILLDDNFTSIQKAVLWGRNVFDSIRKFVQFQLTVNIVAVTTAFVGAVTTGESPLGAVQMLWVNLIMDTLAALALATQQPTPDLLNRKPYGRHAALITYQMWRQIIGQAIFQLAVLGVLVFASERIPYLDLPKGNDSTGHPEGPYLVKLTVIFNTFVFMQVFNEINCRKLGNEFNIVSGIFSNPIFLAVFFFTVTAQTLMVEFGGAFMQTTGLNWKQWIFCLGVGFFSIPWGLALRLIPVPAEKEFDPSKDKADDEVDSKGHSRSKKSKEGKKEESEKVPLLQGGKSPSTGKAPPSDEHRIEINTPESKQRAIQNWRKAQNVVTEQMVVSAFRRTRPGTRF